MFNLALLIGIYPYLIFILGLTHLLNQKIILIVTVLYTLFFGWFFRKPSADLFKFFFKLKWESILNLIYYHKLPFILFCLLILQILVNLIGALGPELAFDALWYHLTIPKIYLAKNSIFYIGGHLYYSAMPKLTELIYLAGLSLGNEIVAKSVHFSFGIATIFALYKLSRQFLTTKDSILTILIFYSNLVVGWMSMTAYIDLARTFFELMALWGFLKFISTNKPRWLITTGLMLGLEISTKLLGLASVGLYIFLIIFFGYQSRFGTGKIVKQAFLICAAAFFTALPWLLFSYFQTGNPVLNNNHFQDDGSFTDPGYLLRRAFAVFLSSADPISPVYFIFLPLTVIYFKRRSSLVDLLTVYVLGGFCISYIGSLASSGRFFLPFLPGFSLLIVLTLNLLRSKFLYKFLLVTILIISFSSILYRGIANKRFIPVILGRETKTEFMYDNLEFNVGNFYDIDGFFQKNIKPTDTILIYGISNLYYVNFPYIHESAAKKGDRFNYVLAKDISLPGRFKDWSLIYQNNKTHIKLYSLGGRMVNY